jgi:hypothetical protein
MRNNDICILKIYKMWVLEMSHKKSYVNSLKAQAQIFNAIRCLLYKTKPRVTFADK